MILVAFRAIYVGAVVLCLAIAGLVTMSLFIADRAPQSAQFLWITIGVSVFFLGLGVLLLAIQGHVTGIARWTRRGGASLAPGVRTHVHRLVLALALGGAGLCFILAILAYAILARIDQGFAVFG